MQTRRYVFPLVAKTPLISPSGWRFLPKTLEVPELPEIDPENVYAAHAEYEGLPPAHIREIWPSLGVR